MLSNMLGSGVDPVCHAARRLWYAGPWQSCSDTVSEDGLSIT